MHLFLKNDFLKITLEKSYLFISIHKETVKKSAFKIELKRAKGGFFTTCQKCNFLL